MVHRTFPDPSPSQNPWGEGALALHGGSKNVHHPCTRLNDDEVYKVDASLYVTLDFTFPPETLRATVIKRRDILKLWQSISKYLITLYINSTLRQYNVIRFTTGTNYNAS